MKLLSFILLIMLAVILASCTPTSQPSSQDTASRVKEPLQSKPSIIPWPDGLPVYDHIVIVIEENKDYDEIIYNPDLPEQPWQLPWPTPYINKLKAEGANFTQIYGEEHFSQGNYFWLFSGDNQNVGFSDSVPTEKIIPNYPFTTPNLASQLIDKGLTFTGYVDSLPEDPMQPRSGTYARKHVPWLSFANVPKSVTVSFDKFPKDVAGFEKLPLVSFVIPDLEHDMHNGPFPQQIKVGDIWLQENIGPYYEWAKDNNSLLILTFDENDDKRQYQGLTNPLVNPETCDVAKMDKEYCQDLQNRIVTIFAGAHIIPGDYPEGKGITHINILRTIEAMYGLPKAGKQQPNAAGAGISDDYIITDVYIKVR
jgi:phosphatidylinositol-3-phosphatase